MTWEECEFLKQQIEGVMNCKPFLRELGLFLSITDNSECLQERNNGEKNDGVIYSISESMLSRNEYPSSS